MHNFRVNKFHQYFLIQLKVMGDDLSVSSDKPSQQRQMLNVRKIAAHPSYKIIKNGTKTPSIRNDIAIIFVCISLL